MRTIVGAHWYRQMSDLGDAKRLYRRFAANIAAALPPPRAPGRFAALLCGYFARERAI
jgi:hypothetical protein